jgi:hypothetical protein
MAYTQLYIERCAHHAKSVTTVVRVSITATVPNNVMGGIRLRHMSPSPDLLEPDKVYHTYRKRRPPKMQSAGVSSIGRSRLRVGTKNSAPR